VTFSIPALMLYMALVGGILGIIIGVAVGSVWVISFVPLMLRDIWAEDSFYVPLPPIPEVQSMTMYDGTPIETLGDYVARQQPSPDSSPR
jgi:ABC-type antimicrobial peptide transport system permease subunit